MRVTVPKHISMLAYRYLGGNGVFDRPIVRNYLAYDVPRSENRGG